MLYLVWRINEVEKFLRIENLLISKAYREIIDYFDEFQNDDLYSLGVKSFACYKYYHEDSYLDSSNPYSLFLSAHNYHKVYQLLNKECDAKAYQYLGLLKYHGLGTNKSLCEARQFFLAAINEGSIPAKTYLAQTYLDEEDFEKGFRLLQESTDFVLSSFYLGNCYFNGYGVFEDKNRAERYYQDASAYGFDEAYYTLGMHHMASNNLNFGIKYSFELLHKAANKGHERALLFLIQYYYDRDESKYLDYLVKAAMVGNSDVKYHLGYDFLMGINLPKDKVKAQYWLNLAAKEGQEQAIKLIDEFFCPIEI